MRINIGQATSGGWRVQTERPVASVTVSDGPPQTRLDGPPQACVETLVAVTVNVILLTPAE